MSTSLNEMEGLLQHNETILWSGQPNPRIHFIAADLINIPFCVLIMVFLLRELFKSPTDIVLIIFIIFGIYFLIGRFFFKYYKKRKTKYYVTNTRVVVFDLLSNRIIQEEKIESIKSITKKIGRIGIGKIEFGRPAMGQLLVGNSGMDFFQRKTILEKISMPESAPWITIFYDIEDVSYVFKLVNELKQSV